MHVSSARLEATDGRINSRARVMKECGCWIRQKNKRSAPSNMKSFMNACSAGLDDTHCDNSRMQEASA